MDDRAVSTPGPVTDAAAVARLRELIADARRIVPFTGAGISTECGIPDFRSPGGVWTKYRPIPFDEFMASQEARDESWRRRLAMEGPDAQRRQAEGKSASRQQEQRDQKRAVTFHLEGTPYTSTSV